MPTINMTDADWTNVLAEFVQAAVRTVNPQNAPQQVAIAVPVTFDASESFTEFAVSVPFGSGWSANEQGTFVGFCYMDPSTAVPLTAFIQNGMGVEISGENTTDDSVDLNVNLLFYVASSMGWQGNTWPA